MASLINAFLADNLVMSETELLTRLTKGLPEELSMTKLIFDDLGVWFVLENNNRYCVSIDALKEPLPKSAEGFLSFLIQEDKKTSQEVDDLEDFLAGRH